MWKHFCNSNHVFFPLCFFWQTFLIFFMSSVSEEEFVWAVFYRKPLMCIFPFKDTCISGIDPQLQSWSILQFPQQYWYILKQMSDENKGNCPLRVFVSVNHQIARTNFKRTVFQSTTRLKFWSSTAVYLEEGYNFMAQNPSLNVAWKFNKTW